MTIIVVICLWFSQFLSLCIFSIFFKPSSSSLGAKWGCQPTAPAEGGSLVPKMTYNVIKAQFHSGNADMLRHEKLWVPTADRGSRLGHCLFNICSYWTTVQRGESVIILLKEIWGWDEGKEWRTEADRRSSPSLVLCFLVVIVPLIVTCWAYRALQNQHLSLFLNFFYSRQTPPMCTRLCG